MQLNERCALTEALEVSGGRCEDQVGGHCWWPGAFGDARLLEVLFDPVRQPLQVTVAVQGVVSERAVKGSVQLDTDSYIVGG